MARTAVARAPGRVNLIGEHTDYNAGLCLPIALPHDTIALAALRTDGQVRIKSEQQPDTWVGTLGDCAPGGPTGWVAYAAGVIWALGQEGYAVPPGIDLFLSSTVPLGAGLSSSASLEVAVAVAVHALMGHELDLDERRRLVGTCSRAETEVVGAPTGGLDQSAALLTERGCALLLDFADNSATSVPLKLTEAGLELVVVDTRVSHALIDGAYGARRRECEAAAQALGVATLRETDLSAVEQLETGVLRRRAHHVVSENARVAATVQAVGRAEWSEVGALLTASHASMRDDFEISCSELDLAVETALAAGALGARMTGGGFGGSAIALVPSEQVAALRAAIDTAYDLAGFCPPHHLDAPASCSARVVSCHD